MRHQAGPSSRRITIADCEICRSLCDVETSFSKWGWDEFTRSLPVAASRLVPVENASSSDVERHQVRRCPICGTFYQYDQSYEYLVNGSEDEEVLTRLTPAQARRYLKEQQYAGLMAWMVECAADAEASVRRYAAQSLVAHHLERDELDQVLAYLRLADPEVVEGVLSFLARESGNKELLARLFVLEPALGELARGPDSEVSRRASYLLSVMRHIGRMTECRAR